jgi:hypothetical protein
MRKSPGIAGLAHLEAVVIDQRKIRERWSRQQTHAKAHKAIYSANHERIPIRKATAPKPPSIAKMA